MKFIVGLFMSCVALFASANEIVIVVGAPAGGSIDAYARSMAKHSSIPSRVENRAGAYNSLSFAYAKENPGSIVIADPGWLSQKSPMKDEANNIELVDMVLGQDLFIISAPNKDRKLDDLLSGKTNIGVGMLGSPNHYIIHQMQKRNSGMEVIPFKGDNIGVLALLRSDVDAYVVTGQNANKWMETHNLKPVYKVPYDQAFNSNGINFNMPYTWLGLWMNKSATPEQRAAAKEYIRQIKRNQNWVNDMKAIHMTPINVTESVKNKKLEDLKQFFKTTDF